MTAAVRAEVEPEDYRLVVFVHMSNRGQCEVVYRVLPKRPPFSNDG